MNTTKIADGAVNPAVSVIPATKRSVQNGGQLKQQKNVRVAAYCRVSTGDESQQTSYTNQRAFYAGMIQSRSGWSFAGIYADEAISGTSRVHRVAFNRMIEDAKAGKLDYIVTKSISRFARNTVDTLNCVRELRRQNPPVGIYFEKENIDTLDATGELILTILSALAQDESRSISDNIRWTLQKNFQAGIPQINLKRMLGYDKGENGEWVINPQQAVIVRHIFERFVCGESANKIAKELNRFGHRTVNGNMWTSGAVLIVLRNEKYVGDLEMQKTITKDFLTHRSIVNRGEAPKYYVRDHHAGIIDRVTWDKVKAMLGEKPVGGAAQKDSEANQQRRPGGSLFFNLRCGAVPAETGKACGEGLSRLTYTGTAKGYTDSRSLAATGGDAGLYQEKYVYAYPVWRCRRKFGGQDCPSELLHECAIEQSFMELLYRLKRDYTANGDASRICSLFREAYARACQHARVNSVSLQRMETLDDQIRELVDSLQRTVEKQVEAMREAALEQNAELRKAFAAGYITQKHIESKIRDELAVARSGDGVSVMPAEDSEAAVYAELAGDLRQRLAELRRQKILLEAEQEVTAIMKRNFDFFLQCLKELPEMNRAGMPIVVHGLDTRHSSFFGADSTEESGRRDNPSGKIPVLPPERIAACPDYLRFEKGIYAAFIVSGVVRGDSIEYTTNFGVKLVATGNRRSQNSFMGFKRCRDDGAVEFLDAPYKVYGNSIQYRRSLRKNASGKEERTEKEK